MPTNKTSRCWSSQQTMATSVALTPTVAKAARTFLGDQEVAAMAARSLVSS